jgi:uncharacterized protein
MTDILLIVLGSIFIIVGLIGCIVPVIPGPPISFLGIIALHFTSIVSYSTSTLILLGFISIFVTILDYLVPIWGTKKAGGSKWGVRGAAIGMIIGLLLTGTIGNFVLPIIAPIIGIILGPFFGAYIGETWYLSNQRHKSNNLQNYNDDSQKAFKAAFGSFLGFMLGIFFKIVVSSFMSFIFVKDIIMGLVN